MNVSESAAPVGAMGHSSVCGQTCDAPPPTTAASKVDLAVPCRVSVLVASDRAHGGVYEDKSGPAIVETVKAFAESSQALSPTFVQQRVVPDEQDTIYSVLKEWSTSRACDVVITSGGTGLGCWDVTPEATHRIIARPADSLARALAWQTSFLEPHSVLLEESVDLQTLRSSCQFAWESCCS